MSLASPKGSAGALGGAGTAMGGAGAGSGGMLGSPAFEDDDDGALAEYDGSGDLSAYGGAGIGGDDEAGKNFMVVIRVRPPLPREITSSFQNVVRVDASARQLIISENLAALDEGGGVAAAGPYATHLFAFDHVYGPECDQKVVYETTAMKVVESSLKGYNATIFAYGQTGTGKTYTMEGFNSAEERGIIPRAIEQIFRHIHSSVSPRMRFLVRASYLQIYNEVISDLLKPERSNLLIREDKKKGVFVEGLSEWVVRSPAEIYGLMERGGATRATASTKMNEISSRSHAVFIVIVEQSETTYLDEAGNEMSVEEFHRLVKLRAHGEAGLKALEGNVRQSFKVGKLNLVDLAGSERVRLTGATGQRLEESKKINQSLSALGNVIASLTEGRPHIPYRDSKLTRILEDSLGGNCKTTMMAMISPALEAFAESLSTLKFANRAKNIKNEARVNEDLDQKSLLRRYERELKRLRAELEERSRSVVDQRRLLELDEQRRRAEEDKMAAIRALEARSREFMREKQEKKRLEERIQLLQGQIMSGGAMALNNVTDMPAFRNALREHQERMKAEYESRLAELEKERESIEEEKAQVDRYKQLLLKQRDIMILLTQRLNERDEQIVALQDELDAYDRHQRDLEEKLDEKTAALIHLQRVTMEHNAASPVKNSELLEALGDWAGMGMGPAAAGLLSAGRAASAAIRAAGPGAAAGAAAGDVPAAALITTRQFRPYADADVTGGAASASATSPVDGSGDGAGGGSSSSAPLLSAEEKIAELSRVVDAMRSERDRLGRELEDVQAEKVSMEYLLREKLEKLVQSEIEARLASYHGQGQGAPGSGAGAMPLAAAAAAGVGAGPTMATAAAALARERDELASQLSSRAAELAAARDEVTRLRAEVSSARAEADSKSESGAASASASAAASASQAQAQAQLRERVEAHEKERRALQTIMEHKVKTLVDAVAAATSSVSDAAAHAQGSGGDGASVLAAVSHSHSRLSREVAALQRLVNASVAAMRNSELYTAPPGSGTGAGTGTGTGPASAGLPSTAPVPATPLPLQTPVRGPAVAGTVGGPSAGAAGIDRGAGLSVGGAARAGLPGAAPPGSAGLLGGRSAGAGASSVASAGAGAAAATPLAHGSMPMAMATPVSIEALVAARKEEMARAKASAATGAGAGIGIGIGAVGSRPPSAGFAGLVAGGRR